MLYMTFTLTTKQLEVLKHLRTKKEPQSVYALAKSLDRPYNRVLGNVRLLSEKGFIGLSERRVDGRRAIVIHRKPVRRSQPQLSYSRVWSAPVTGVNDTVFIASALADPTFDDVLICCRHYGMARVREVFSSMLGTDELSPLIQQSLSRILANIEIGFARAA